MGLGNPGTQYAGSRHNLGADAVEVLARRSAAELKAGRERARAVEVRWGPARVALAVPTTYMNESGEAVVKLVKRYGIDDVTRLVIVHDELDLPVGGLRVKEGGGLAGHNGLRSIKAHLKTTEFVRVRLGVGKPPSSDRGADHVLGKVSKADRAEFEVAVQEAADAVEAIVADGPVVAMNRFNR